MPHCCRREKSLKDKIILITGSGSGIGRELAIQLGKFRPILVLWSRVETTNDVTKRMVFEKYPEYEDKLKVYSFQVNVGNLEEVIEAAKVVENEIGQVDVLINNAGMINGKKLIDLHPDEIRTAINTNLMAHYWTIKAFLPSMLERDEGHIVAMSSVAGIVGSSHLTDYSATKFAMMGLMESLDVELKNMGKTNIRLTTVCPYFVNTGMFAGIQTRFHAILPILTPEFVARRTIQALRSEKQFLYLPRFLYVVLATRGLTPHRALRYVGYMFGAHEAMATFTGRDEIV